MPHVNLPDPDDLETLGPYRLISKIADGGMGKVFHALHMRRKREVALKVLAPDLAGDERYIERFQREAKASQNIRDPNVVKIYDVGKASGNYYMALELIDGIPLDEIIEKEGEFSVEKAVRVILQAASGLAAAHQIGVIHRDVKPANMMLTSGDILKVMDFGLVKSIHDESGLTQTGFVMGTPQYMCPDHVSFDNVDHRVDIYALGISFYELLTGSVPFDDTDAICVLESILHNPMPDIRRKRPDVPHEIAEVLRRMTAKDAAKRYQSMREVASALVKACEVAGMPYPGQEKTRTESARRRAAAGRRRHRRAAQTIPVDIEQARKPGKMVVAVMIVLIGLLVFTGLIISMNHLLP